MVRTTGRPVFLNLLQIRLPLPGIVSIGHRLSGVALVLSIPFVAHLFALSLSGPEGFARAAAILDAWPVKLLLLLLIWGLVHHLLAGLRHLAMDFHWGLEKPVARVSAIAVLGGAAAVGLLLWGALV